MPKNLDQKLIFAHRLKKARIARAISQAELAKQMKITAGAVGNWESGKRIPDAESLVCIAEFLDTSVDYLLGNDKNDEVDNTELPSEYDKEFLKIWSGFSEEQKKTTIDFMKMFKK